MYGNLVLLLFFVCLASPGSSVKCIHEILLSKSQYIGVRLKSDKIKILNLKSDKNVDE